MAVNYPNGKKFHAESRLPKTAKKKEFIYSNRGMTLEEEINSSNEHYLSSGKAVIHKKPTPIQVVKWITPKEVPPSSKKWPTIVSPPLPTITVFTRGYIWTLRLKKQKTRQPYLEQLPRASNRPYEKVYPTARNHVRTDPVFCLQPCLLTEQFLFDWLLGGIHWIMAVNRSLWFYWEKTG